jgi:pSer/pThr/pTyr-binding forkhead associated (FHA) protein
MPKMVWLEQNAIVEREVPERGFLSIGRGTDNTIVLSDPQVSRYHAQLVCGPHGCLLKDLKSTNGVQVNGEMVQSRFLQDGDIIRLGNHVLEFLSHDRSQRLANGAHSGQNLTSLRVTTGGSPLGIPRPASSTGPRAFLRCIDGPEKGRVQAIDRPLLPIGDPDGVHAAVSQRTNGFYLLNLGRSLYVQLNGTPVHGAGVLLRNGDRISLGDNQLEMRIFGPEER